MKNPNKCKGAGSCYQSNPEADRYLLRACRRSGVTAALLVCATRVVVRGISMVAEELGRDNDVSKLLEKPLILGPAESRVNRTLYPLPLSAITVFGKFEGRRSPNKSHVCLQQHPSEAPSK